MFPVKANKHLKKTYNIEQEQYNIKVRELDRLELVIYSNTGIIKLGYLIFSLVPINWI